MLINDVKIKFYDILSSLGYNVVDYPEETTTFPCVFLKLSGSKRDLFNKNFKFEMKFKIDIFSNYDGEKEIMEMQEEIFNAAQALYDVVGVTYVRESDFRILDDKSTSLVRKHGILIYTIYSAGMVQEVEDEQDDSTNPQGS